MFALVGCSSDGSTADPSAQDTTNATVTDEAEPGVTASDETGTETPVEAQAATVPGPCPYLEQELVEGIVGQKISAVLVTTTTPQTGPLPKCEFQRSSGEPAATTDTLTIKAGEGLAKSLELVPGGNPVSAGEGGSVIVHQGQDRTDLVAFSGTTLVSVTINQESSLEATDLAETVLAAAG